MQAFIAQRYGALLQSSSGRLFFGTPLVGGRFCRSERRVSTDLFCYVRYSYKLT